MGHTTYYTTYNIQPTRQPPTLKVIYANKKLTKAFQLKGELSLSHSETETELVLVFAWH